MDERNPAPSGPLPGYLIDQPVVVATTRVQRRVQVGHSEADVVNARTPLREELGDWAVGFAWCEEFDIDLAKGDGNYFSPVGCFWGGCREVEYVPIELRGFSEVAYRDANVGDAGWRIGHVTSVSMRERPTGASARLGTTRAQHTVRE